MYNICMYVGMSRMSNKLRRRNYVVHAHAQSHFWSVKTDLCTRVIDFDYALEQLYHGRKRNVHLEMRNLE